MRVFVSAALCMSLAACAVSYEPEPGEQASSSYPVLGEFDTGDGPEAALLYELDELPGLDDDQALERPATEQNTPLGFLSWHAPPPVYNLVGASRSAYVSTNVPPPGGAVFWDLNGPSGSAQLTTGVEPFELGYRAGVRFRLTARGEYFLSAQTLDGGFTIADFVAHNPPVAQSISVSGTLKTGKEITFTGGGSIDTVYSKYGENGTPALFRWTIAGKTKNGRVVKHTFSSAGTYTIKLKVYDGTYWSPVKSKSVTIGSANPPPLPPLPPCPYIQYCPKP